MGNTLLLIVMLCMATLFWVKFKNPSKISWLTLALIVVLGGWCAIILWHSSSIDAGQATLEKLRTLLSDQRLRAENPEFWNTMRMSYESIYQNTQMMIQDHFAYFTRFGWVISLGYFALLSSLYGICYLVSGKGRRPMDKGALTP